MENGIFYHEHGSWEERVRIDIAKLKVQMLWTFWGLFGLVVLSAFLNWWIIMSLTIIFLPIIEAVMYLELLYKKQLLKTKRGEI